MHLIDWIVLIGTISAIVLYGLWQTRNSQSADSFNGGDKDLKWWSIGLSIMATQASGITFLSTPGQAYENGMGFVQFYFGLPLAMIILSVFFLPIYYNLKVFTAYEYLEQRFGVKARTLTASLFLLQRGLAAGLSIYAPSIILSKIMNWNLEITTFGIALLVIIYTVVGGSKAVSKTQQQQMTVIFLGLFAAFVTVLYRLPQDISFSEAVNVAGNLGKMNIVDFNFDPASRYNIWSAMLGGTFLFLSYFGTDQSQVQRYLSGKTLTESRLGLIFNGLLKIPMQFIILFVGTMVFVFYLFNTAPLHFNSENVSRIQQSDYATQYKVLEIQHQKNTEAKQTASYDLVKAQRQNDNNLIAQKTDDLKNIIQTENKTREEAKELIKKNDASAQTKDTDYVFITFVMNQLPIGLVGLLLAVIFSAAMSSSASEISALATTTSIDIYKRLVKKEASDAHYLKVSKGLTILWGLIILMFAIFASLFDNLIQAVNIIGSIFYGVILGIFFVAFFFKKIQEKAVVSAAIIAQLMIIALFFADKYGYVKIAFLWFNLIGPILVISFSSIFQHFFKKENNEQTLDL
jgi:solute:Na+ symporter, SSS family